MLPGFLLVRIFLGQAYAEFLLNPSLFYTQERVCIGRQAEEVRELRKQSLAI